MANIKPTVVLVPGFSHFPATYSKSTDSLRSAGYEVRVPRLLSMLATKVDVVCRYVEFFVEAGLNA